MLLCGRAAALGRAPIWKPSTIRSLLFDCTRYRPLSHAPFIKVAPPPVGTVSVGALSNLCASDSIDDFLSMGLQQEAPAPKRQKTGDGPATNGNGRDVPGAKGRAQGGQQNGRKVGGKKIRDLRVGELQQAVKHNDLQRAMGLFREMVADGCNVQLHVLNSLFYVACGGEQWERYVRGLPPLTGEEAAAAAAAAEGEAAEEAVAGQDGGAERESGVGADASLPPAPAPAPAPVPAAAPAPASSREELMSALAEVWGYLGGAGVEPDQTTYLGLARWEALKGDAQAALQWAEECGNKGKSVQLRLFHPALVCYCMAADVAALDRVDSRIAARGLDNTEYEFARLCEGIAAAGSYSQMRAVLVRMQNELNQLSPSTAAYITAFFESNPAAQQAFLPPDQGGCQGLAAAAAAAAATAEAAAAEAAVRAVAAAEAEAEAAVPAAEAAEAEAAEAAAAAAVPAAAAAEVEAAVPAAEAEAAVRADASSSAGVSNRSWRVVRGVAVEESGRCEAAGGALRIIDLEDAEWDSFAEAIAELARTNMGHRASDFNAYAEWFARNGPYDILVDAANVAFFGQNRAGGGFSWNQIHDMYKLLTGRFPEKKILVMLHKKRLNDAEAKAPDVQGFLEKLKRRKSFYYTPPGANDDWYWLYACVKAKHKGLLISNDELRDHIFSLLRPKHFLKWKARHIAHYTFNAEPPTMSYAKPKGSRRFFELIMPQPYTSCVQQLPESGAWMLPLLDGSWVCVQPAGAE